MNEADLCYTPATELAGLIRRKQISPVEVIDAVLGRIEALEPKINAFATVPLELFLRLRRELKSLVLSHP